MQQRNDLPSMNQTHHCQCSMDQIGAAQWLVNLSGA